jgi:hypothetical protein
MAQALPRNINLADQKPNAVNSYIRRYRNIQTNSNGDNAPLSEIIIPIDTGTPGAFLDVAQSYLQFDLKITNQNPYIDFIDFGLSGVNAVFEQMQIRCNGTGIETIKDYNTVYETWMKMEGICQTEFEMFQSRKSNVDRSGWCGTSINSCKPPMVDMWGRIMHSQSNVQVYNTAGACTAPNSFGYDFITGETSAYGPYMGPDYAIDASAAMFISPVRGKLTKPGIRQYDYGSSNINQWPQSIGVEPNPEQISDRASLRFQDYMTYLSNVKNIPVGCTTSLSPTTTAPTTTPTILPGWTYPQSVSGSAGFLSGSFQGTFTVPLLSGLLGVMASKMVPTMLLDNFQLVLTLTAAGKAFKVSMDPCRRIPGTHRDFLVYLGNELGTMDQTTSVGTSKANTLLPTALNSQPSYAIMSPPLGDEYVTDDMVITLAGISAYTPTTLVCNPLTGVGAGTTATETPTIPTIYQPAGYAASYFPADGPVPQYFQSPACTNNVAYQCSLYGTGPVVVGTPTTIGVTGTLTACIGNDGHGCYGTYLKNSVAQTARCIKNTSLVTATPGGYTYSNQYTDSNQGVGQYMPSFSVTNIYYVAQQVIIPDAVTAQILQSAAHGDISIQTTTIQVFNSINCSAASGTQNIIIPAKVGSANTMLGLFRHPTQTNYSTKQFLVNSLSGICPIGCCKFTADSTSYVGTSNAPTLKYITAGAAGSTNNASNWSFQLSIGNDLVPAQPMSSVTELLSELEKCQHSLHMRYNNMSFGATLIPDPTGTATSNAPGQLVYDVLKHGEFTTTWVDPDFLSDQTIVNNLNWAYLQKFPTANMTAANWEAVPVGPYKLEMFKHPDSNFILGFDLDTWSAFSDVAMSGRYLGNNTVSLKCYGLTTLENYAEVFNYTQIVMCDARWSFQAGGNSQLFT